MDAYVELFREFPLACSLLSGGVVLALIAAVLLLRRGN